jgi:hypothetical protein
MNNSNIFKGQCFGCNNKWRYIAYMQSWKGIKQEDGYYFRGGWINMCLDCCKKFGLKPNRTPNVCKKCSIRFIGKKDNQICSKCDNVSNSEMKTQSNLIKEISELLNIYNDDKAEQSNKLVIPKIK